MKRIRTATLCLFALAIPALAVWTDVGGPAVADEAQERFDALEAEANAVMDAWMKEIREKMKQAREAGEELPESEMTSPLADFMGGFEEGARDYAGTEGAVPFLVWIVNEGGRVSPDKARAAFVTLCDDHVESPGLEPLADMLPYMDMVFPDHDMKPYLRKIAAGSSVPVLRDQAGFAVHTSELEAAEAGSKELLAAKAALEEIRDRTEDPRLQSMIERKILIVEKFGNGMVAPDIEGIDLDGVAFKLSDYKGKVIFLDFWGDW